MEDTTNYVPQKYEVENWLNEAEEMIADMKAVQAKSQELKSRGELAKSEIQELTMRLAEKQAEEVEITTKLEENARQFQEKKELLKILVDLSITPRLKPGA